MDENSNYLYRQLPVFGHQLKTNNPYGTFPGKNNLSRHNNNESEFSLLKSTANTFEVDWQPPINTTLFPLLSSCRNSPTTKKKMRAYSPQKSILKCNALPANSLNINIKTPNMFDCPTSSSTLTLGNNIVPKNFLEDNLNTNNKPFHKLILNKSLYKVIFNFNK